MSDLWTDDDRAAAKKHGWNVFDIWDSKRNRLELEIQNDGGFTSDELARAFVLAQVKGRDPLAEKAARLVFVSKTGGMPKKGRKK